MEDSRFDNILLLDFYGELLTDKQRECCDLHYNEDMSLSEIAEHMGISRQGVWDNIRRAQAAMESMEEKTGIVRRFSDTKRSLASVCGMLEKLADMTEGRAQKTARDAERQLRELMDRG